MRNYTNHTNSLGLRKFAIVALSTVGKVFFEKKQKNAFEKEDEFKV